MFLFGVSEVLHFEVPQSARIFGVLTKTNDPPGKPKEQKQKTLQLGRALGHFIFSLIGLKRILFANIFQNGTFYIFPYWAQEDLIYLYFSKALKAPPSQDAKTAAARAGGGNPGASRRGV